MKAVHLSCEYLQNPLGIDILRPRLGWWCEGGRAQSAYRIVAVRKGETVWDTGKVASASCSLIPYEGPELRSRDRIEWSVTLWDENGMPGEASSAWFEMGLLEASDWKASWVAGDCRPRKNTRYPADCFLREFEVRGPVARTRLYITACGVYEARLNGGRVGDFVLAPGSTDYRKRIQYQTYDVAGQLRKGTNKLEVTLADGWFRGSIGCFGKTNVFGRQTKLLAQLEIAYEDGSRDVVVSDDSFRWSNDGPVRFADLKDGEVVNAVMSPSYKGHAVVAQAPAPVPSASNNVPVTEHEVFSPALLTTPSGKTVLDFGQNMAGYLRFRAKGAPGARVRLVCGEILDENGELTQANFQERRLSRESGQVADLLTIMGQIDKVPGPKQLTPLQTIDFFCSGGEDEYTSRFCVFGFRYAELTTSAELSDVEAVAVYSDLEQTGAFSCSNEKVNRLFQNIQWSMKSNFLDVPTDCPTRERLAWTGDAQVFFNSGAYLMNTAPFMRKWMADLRDGQFKDGKVSAVVPYNGMSMVYDSTGSSAGWADASILVPYRFWKRYGDRRSLEENYDMMSRLARWMIANTGHKDRRAAKADPLNKYVYEKGTQLGEWLEPKEFQDTQNSAGAKLTLQTECATAYLAYSMGCMAEVARELGRAEDEALFSEYADGARRAYQRLFLADGAPRTDRQCKLVRPLAFGLAPDELRPAIEGRLAEAVEARGYRIGTGFLSTPFVLDVLCRAGRADLAYKMLLNEENPGWLYEVNQGATTVWEDWDGEASRNHYSPGSVAEWLFSTVAGIRVVGERCFAIDSVPGEGLDWVEASYASPWGVVRTRWERTANGVEVTASIPPNCNLSEGTGEARETEREATPASD